AVHGIAELRLPPPELDRTLVEVGDKSIGVTSVRRGRQLRQQVAELQIAPVPNGLGLRLVTEYPHIPSLAPPHRKRAKYAQAMSNYYSKAARRLAVPTRVEPRYPGSNTPSAGPSPAQQGEAQDQANVPHRTVSRCFPAFFSGRGWQGRSGGGRMQRPG